MVIIPSLIDAGSKRKSVTRLGWMDGVKGAFGNRGMMVEASQQCAKDRKECRAMVHMELNNFHTASFPYPCVLSNRPPILWWLSPGEGWDAVTRCSWDKM